MTAAERREFLQSCGWDVARKPFNGSRGLVYYALELQADGSRGQKGDRAGRQYSVDLESGAWNRWGTAEWCSWSSGPWHGSEAEADPEELPEFVGECLGVGFVRDPEDIGVRHLVDGVDLGLRWLIWEGKRYLAYPPTRILIRRFTNYTLDDFGGTSGRPPRPFVSMKNQPVEISGRNKQGSLF